LGSIECRQVHFMMRGSEVILGYNRTRLCKLYKTAQQLFVPKIHYQSKADLMCMKL
jgi:hypothetical protein